MFYLKNDDMEELFRKAAENYELDTSKASDWDGISKKLDATGGGGNDEDGKKKKKRRFIFWWFLLFPAGWMAHNTWDKIGKNAFKQKTVAERQVIKEQFPGQLAKKEMQPDDETKASAQTPEPEEETGLLSKPDETIAGIDIVNEKVAGNTNTGNNPGMPAEKNKNNSKENKPSASYTKLQPHTISQQLKANPGNKTVKDAIDHTQADQKDKLLTSAPAVGENYGLTALPQSVSKSRFVLPGLSIMKHIPAGVAITPADSLTKTKVESSFTPKNRYFYAGIMAAPDLTSVKFQRIAGTGSSIGVLLGYRFNKRLQAEAAGYWEKKVYYTNGEYFDKSKMEYLRNHEVYNVDGNCHMITIPVNLRYNFISKKNSDWFVTGGAAAYLMQKEYYDITYDYYGDRRTRGYIYKDAPKNWLATVNVGIGYQAMMWKSFNFRVEPYFRIPVSGVGTGNLSLTSAGVYIGIGRKF